MSESFTLNFPVVEAKLLSGDSMLIPLLLPRMVRINSSLVKLGNDFRQYLQNRYLISGRYLEILKIILPSTIKKKTVEVYLEKASDGLLYPEFNIKFEFLYARLNNGLLLGFIPVLELESTGKNLEDLEKNIRQCILQEFSRKNRINSVKSILETMWFREYTVRNVPVDVEFYTFNELDEMWKHEDEKFLAGAAWKITLNKSPDFFGFEEEKIQLEKALTGMYSKSILLIGRSGTGKTTLIYDAVYNKEKYGLSSVEFLETTAARLIQKLAVDRGWQQNIAKLIQEIRKSDLILYIRNLADLFEVGQYEGNDVSLAEYMKPYIESGEVRLITECDEDQAAKIELQSSGFTSLFNIVRFRELPQHEVEVIIEDKIKCLTAENQVKIDPEVVNEIFLLQDRYNPYSGFPGKTVRFFESAILNTHETIKELDRKLLLEHFCTETGMPGSLIDHEIPLDVEKVEDFFRSRIFGQEQAIETIIGVIIAIKTSLSRSGKPIASLVFVGPTGVGKTETAKVLAEFMFGSRRKFIRFDMSEYSDAPSIVRLTGDGGLKKGLLTSSVHQEPFSVVLFDELEKAHYSFFDLLLQILGQGRLTDSNGRVTNFCSTVIIMTSNIGTGDFKKLSTGFYKDQDEKTSSISHFKKAVQDFFRPELFNRIDQIVSFVPLGRESMRAIVEREIDSIKKKHDIQMRVKSFEISSTAIDYLCVKGYDPEFGARQMQRTIRTDVLIPLARKINKYNFDYPIEIKIDAGFNDLDIEVKAWRFISEANCHSHEIYRIVDEVSDRHSELQKIMNGGIFLQFLNSMDIMEKKKAKLKNAFWKLPESGIYEKHSGVIKNTYNLLQTISEIEEKLDLLFLENKELDHSLEQKFIEWEDDYINNLKEIYQIFYPEYNICTIWIFGSELYLRSMAEIYLSLGYRKKFRMETGGIWLKEDDYIWNWEMFNNQYILKPPEGCKNLVGMLIQFEGELPYLFFRDEEGRHQFFGDKIFHDYLVIVHNNHVGYFPTSEKVHRKKYIDSFKIRRKYTGNLIEDFTYKIEAETVIFDEFLEPFLNRNLINNLTNSFISD